MLLVRFVDAIAVHEIEPPHDANAVGDALQGGRQFVVVGCRHQRQMERFVERRHLAAVSEAFARRRLPDRVKLIEKAAQPGGKRPIALTKPADREGFDQLAHFVQIVEALEVDRHDFPAAAHVTLHQTVALQPLQGFARRRPRHVETLRDTTFGQTVSRQQPQFEDVVAQLCINVVRARRTSTRRGCQCRSGWGHGFGGCNRCGNKGVAHDGRGYQ